MAIGTGIFLIAVGAILAFALNESVDAINLYLVGWILMGAGVLAVIISLVVNAQNRKRTTVTEQRVDRGAPQQAPAPQQGGQVTERREDTGPAV
ncbi:DUF6458 family protein [Demequina sp. NBRC 110056]|uniref:DUF6458 family protein n=1 Tax=Demequina sp. NBRC 110056 TaxID=1570345 RepID=UPI000A05DF8A|nr:DUF6458 family protein [Demequina sp. NBRC 110056]